MITASKTIRKVGQFVVIIMLISSLSFTSPALAQELSSQTWYEADFIGHSTGTPPDSTVRDNPPANSQITDKQYGKVENCGGQLCVRDGYDSLDFVVAPSQSVTIDKGKTVEVTLDARISNQYGANGKMVLRTSDGDKKLTESTSYDETFTYTASSDNTEIQGIYIDYDHTKDQTIYARISEITYVQSVEFAHNIDGYQSTTKIQYSPSGENKLYSKGFEKEITLPNRYEEAENIYVEINSKPGNSGATYEVVDNGRVIGSAVAESGVSGESVIQIEPKSKDVTLRMTSSDTVAVSNVSVTALAPTPGSDPLNVDNSGPEEIDSQGGYDRVLGALSQVLSLTTQTVYYLMFASLAIGAVVFVYSKGLRGTEFSQSLMMAAIIVGVSVLLFSSILNMSAWLFTGDNSRASLGNPNLEAEPPVYYNNGFNDGKLDNWKAESDSTSLAVRSHGNELALTGSGQSLTISREVDITLGNSLDTGYINYDIETISSDSVSDHAVTVYANVYIDGEQVVTRKEIARSFGGQTVSKTGSVIYEQAGTDVTVEFVAESNDNSAAANLRVYDISVGATAGSHNPGEE
ncbi:hypothetical protein [Haloarcula sp. K1]|uniref:hypothetical protein n=1 Tax=Haloarcula sp. K1 TaxID=1622207 RepID=UPI000ACD663C|nr:hypothetical protein [Haloarcula sp. K1]